MHAEDLDRWTHHHTFGTDERLASETRTWWVIGLTAVMMTAEIAAGIGFGSMALLADGWHMGTHAAALGIAVFAYVYARRNADNPNYSFGTGKVGALGGFASAVALAVVALLVLAGSLVRLASPVTISFDEAIAVAVLGLVVNLVSAWMLRGHDHHHHDEHHHHDAHDHHDHNLRGAYLHVLADALTSVLAIVALVAGKHLGWVWMDPLMGIVGSLVIARWSYGLLRDTAGVLLDAEVPPAKRANVRAAIEADADNRVADLHLWRVGPRHLGAIISVVTHAPREPGHYKSLLQSYTDLVHVTVEVLRCDGAPCGTGVGGRE
jgi:cation diffusion facilitator family transporter